MLNKITSQAIHNIHSVCRRGALLSVFLNLIGLAHAETVSTADIVSRTISAVPSCTEWTPVGACFWLDCSILGCTVRTSPKVGHYQPDAVVSVYNELGENPWNEARALLGGAQKATASGILSLLTGLAVDSAGNRAEGANAQNQHKNLIFREADVIGHPLTAFGRFLPAASLICQSETRPLVPYFQSAVDAFAWRTEIPEILYPASIIPGLRELGQWPAYTWGPIHPRTGWATQSDEAKAAALIAQRAGDIVTRLRQPHLYLPTASTASDTEQRIWPPGPLLETDSASGQWQMLTPKAESSCAAFGENDLLSLSSWGGGRVAPGGDYAWNLWRPYRCCARLGELFLFSIDVVDFP